MLTFQTDLSFGLPSDICVIVTQQKVEHSHIIYLVTFSVGFIMTLAQFLLNYIKCF